ncbi:MAG: glycosyltransferase [Myxococcales bacterium]|nr:glycosyltransferase [Myxococcales bacterium]
MGVATIATRIPGCVDVVTDDVTGSLVAPGDVAALTAAIDRDLAEPARRARLGAAARAHVLRAFRMTDVWTRVADEYARLIAAPRR